MGHLFGHFDLARAAIFSVGRAFDPLVAFGAAEQIAREVADAHPGLRVRARQRTEHRPLLGGHAERFEGLRALGVQHVDRLEKTEEQPVRECGGGLGFFEGEVGHGGAAAQKVRHH